MCLCFDSRDGNRWNAIKEFNFQCPDYKKRKITDHLQPQWYKNNTKQWTGFLVEMFKIRPNLSLTHELLTSTDILR